MNIPLLATKTIYHQAFFTFGLLPLLMLLDEYEGKEYYNECYCIKATIDDINKAYNESLETRWGIDAINQIKHHQTVNGDDWANYYANLHGIKKDARRFINDQKQRVGIALTYN